MWTTLKALPPTKYFLQFCGCYAHQTRAAGGFLSGAGTCPCRGSYTLGARSDSSDHPDPIKTHAPNFDPVL